MSIPTNPVSAGSATKKSDYDALYNGSVLVNTGGTPGGAQSIPGVKTFSATTTFESGLIASAASTFHEGITASATSSVFALSNKINLRAGFVASGTCTYYAPVSGEESAGTLHIIPEADRSSSWPLSGGNTTSFTDVDFGAWTPSGVKAVLVYGFLTHPYQPGGYFGSCFRKNGSTETNNQRLQAEIIYNNNLNAGKTIEYYFSSIIIECDENGIIEYRNFAGATLTGGLYLNIMGYYI